MRARTALLSLTTLACLALPGRASAVTQTAAVKAKVLKPLTLEALRDLDLGTITLKPGSWSNATVGISRTGVFSCASANLICSGPSSTARYKVAGSNKETAIITAPNVTLVNQSDPTKTLILVVDNPGQVTLTSSGKQGSTFDLGGSITLDSTTASGDYTGTFNVTVDYQ
jgi:hypothetical protein